MSRKRKLWLFILIPPLITVSLIFLTSDVFTKKPSQVAFEKALRERTEAVVVDHTRPTTFRNTYWGMTEAQVKAVEEWTPSNFSLPNAITYEGTLFDVPCLLAYYLREGKADAYRKGPLSGAAYFFRGKYLKTPVVARDVFLGIDKYLNAMYGPAIAAEKHGYKDRKFRKLWDAKNAFVFLHYDPYQIGKSGTVVSVIYESLKPRLRSQN